jgi:hypothetical protein
MTTLNYTKGESLEYTKRYGSTTMDPIRNVYRLGRIDWLSKNCGWLCNHTNFNSLGSYLSTKKWGR